MELQGARNPTDYRSPYGPRRCLSDPGRERHISPGPYEYTRPSLSLGFPPSIERADTPAGEPLRQLSLSPTGHSGLAYVRVFQAVHPQCDHTSVMGWKSTGADLEAVWARARSLSRLWDKLEERGMGLPASGYRNEDWGRCRLITRALPHTRRGHIGPSYKCTRNGI